jgi:hypothetical protein
MNNSSLNEWDEMAALNYWRLCDELSVMQAALLYAFEDPSKNNYVEELKTEERPTGYEAAKTAISNALRKGKIEGELIPFYQTDINGNNCEEIPGSIDVKISRVDVESLRAYIKSQNISTGFFFPEISDSPEYLNPKSPRYAPKLAAAVNAWLAVTVSEKLSPKKALEKWLRENAVKYGMTDHLGNPINQAIEECSKVANWQLSGGAPKTPGGNLPTP